MNTAHPANTDGQGLRIAVLRSRFNELITQRLLDGALAALRQHGVSDGDVEVLEVPGAVELPLAADLVAARGEVDAVVCLGAVIRGETSHYDHVCRLAADGLQKVMLERKLPVAFGVLTCETMDQALARSGSGAANRGFDAATVALEMVHLARWMRRETTN